MFPQMKSRCNIDFFKINISFALASVAQWIE